MLLYKEINTLVQFLPLEGCIQSPTVHLHLLAVAGGFRHTSIADLRFVRAQSHSKIAEDFLQWHHWNEFPVLLCTVFPEFLFRIYLEIHQTQDIIIDATSRQKHGTKKFNKICFSFTIMQCMLVYQLWICVPSTPDSTWGASMVLYKVRQLRSR